MNNISPQLVLIRECIIGYKNLEIKFDKLFKSLEKKLDKVHSNQKRLHSKVDEIKKCVSDNEIMNGTLIDVNIGSTTQKLFQEIDANMINMEKTEIYNQIKNIEKNNITKIDEFDEETELNAESNIEPQTINQVVGRIVDNCINEAIQSTLISKINENIDKTSIKIDTIELNDLDLDQLDNKDNGNIRMEITETVDAIKENEANKIVKTDEMVKTDEIVKTDEMVKTDVNLELDSVKKNTNEENTNTKDKTETQFLEDLIFG